MVLPSNLEELVMILIVDIKGLITLLIGKRLIQLFCTLPGDP